MITSQALFVNTVSASKKRRWYAMVEGGVKDNGKINLHMYLNNDDSNYIFQAFGSIAAGNAARKACIA